MNETTLAIHDGFAPRKGTLRELVEALAGWNGEGSSPAE